MGPQLGYYYPEIVLEADLHGPGIKAQGAFVPGGGPYVLIGRTKDYAWSLTSASNDNRDQFLEKLCEPDGSAPTRDSRHYVYKGQCRRDDHVRRRARSAASRRSSRSRSTARCPAPPRSAGKPYAIARLRSTYGEDALSLARAAGHDRRARQDRQGLLRLGQPVRLHVQLGLREPRHHRLLLVRQAAAPRAAARTSCCPRSAPATTTGAGSSRTTSTRTTWAGPDGLFLNWNNKPAPGWQTGDDDRSYGSVHRVEMFDDFPRHARIADVVSIMNRAATEDLRATVLWPVIRRVLGRLARPGRAHRPGGRPAHRVVERRRQQARRRPRRQDRRSGRRDHRPRLDQHRERRADAEARRR